MQEQTLLERVREWYSKNCVAWWRYWSNQLAILIAAAAAWVAENPTTALSFVESIEQPWRSALVFIITAGVPIAIRMARQPKLEK